MKEYIYDKARKEGKILLPEHFFKAYAETGVTPEAAADALDEMEPKDSYTRAEVDDIVNRKIAEAMESMKTPVTTEPEKTTAEEAEEITEE